jgi:hypothetical protein
VNESSLTPHCSFTRSLPGWNSQRNENCIDPPAQAHGGATRALRRVIPAMFTPHPSPHFTTDFHLPPLESPPSPLDCHRPPSFPSAPFPYPHPLLSYPCISYRLPPSHLHLAVDSMPLEQKQRLNFPLRLVCPRSVNEPHHIHSRTHE